MIKWFLVYSQIMFYNNLDITHAHPTYQKKLLYFLTITSPILPSP